MELRTIQKEVLCALAAYPQYNDRELAAVLHSTRSTVTAARLFLERNKVYSIHLFPQYQHLQVSLIGIKYGNYGKFIPITYPQRMELLPQNMKIEENVWSISSQFKGMSLFFAGDFSAIKEKIDAWNSLFEGIDPSVAIRDIYIPTSMIGSYKFLELHHYLATVLKVKPFSVPAKSIRNRILRKKEKKVLLAWVQHPLATNAELAKKINISRASIGAIKTRLLESGGINKILIPHWPLLGISLGALVYLKLNPQNPVLLATLKATPQVIFLVGSKYEAILFAVFRDYTEYQQTVVPLLKRFKQEKSCIKEPEEILFSLAETQFSCNSAPLIEKIVKS